MSTGTRTGGNAKVKKIVIGMVAAVAVAVCSVIGLTGCKKSDNDGKDVVTIGAILPLTGKYADPGNGVRAGLEFAVRRLNSSGKASYKLEYYDTQSETKNALTGYARLKTINKANVFFTHFSDHSLILKPEAIKNESLLFCLAPHTDITKDNGQLVFRPFGTSIDEANCLLLHIFESLHSKRIFIYSFLNETGLDFESFFREQLGSHLIGTCFYEEDAATLRNIATANTYKNADCIVVHGSTPAMGFLIKLIRESGYSGSILANPGFYLPTVLAAAGDYAKTVSFVDYDFPWQSEQHKSWNDEAMATYKSSFTLQSYIAYGAFHIFAEIYSSGIHSPRDIGKQLSREKTYKLKADKETLEFTTHPDGGITTRMRMNSISDNK